MEKINMEQYKNYIFDLYGTLVDIHTDEERDEAWEKMALLYGYAGAWFQPDELRNSFIRHKKEEKDNVKAKCVEGTEIEINIEAVFRKLYEEKGIKAENMPVLQTCQFFRILTTDYIRLYPGTRKYLETLKKSKKRIYLLSNAQRCFTEYELRLLDLEKCFDGIFLSSDYGVKKPDAAFFKHMLQETGIDKHESIMIGNDMVCDILAAQNIGLDAFYVHTNLSPREDEKFF